MFDLHKTFRKNKYRHNTSGLSASFLPWAAGTAGTAGTAPLARNADPMRVWAVLAIFSVLAVEPAMGPVVAGDVLGLVPVATNPPALIFTNIACLLCEESVCAQEMEFALDQALSPQVAVL